MTAEKERGGRGGGERKRDNNSSCSRNIKNKSVLYKLLEHQVTRDKIRRCNNDGLRSAAI